MNAVRAAVRSTCCASDFFVRTRLNMQNDLQDRFARVLAELSAILIQDTKAPGASAPDGRPGGMRGRAGNEIGPVGRAPSLRSSRRNGTEVHLGGGTGAQMQKPLARGARGAELGNIARLLVLR